MLTIFQQNVVSRFHRPILVEDTLSLRDFQG